MFSVILLRFGPTVITEDCTGRAFSTTVSQSGRVSLPQSYLDGSACFYVSISDCGQELHD